MNIKSPTTTKIYIRRLRERQRGRERENKLNGLQLSVLNCKIPSSITHNARVPVSRGYMGLLDSVNQTIKKTNKNAMSTAVCLYVQQKFRTHAALIPYEVAINKCSVNPRDIQYVNISKCLSLLFALSICMANTSWVFDSVCVWRGRSSSRAGLFGANLKAELLWARHT